MLTLFGLLLVQEAPPNTDILKYLGPFVVYAVPSGLWIRDLLARLKDSRDREQLLSDRLVELAERSLPLMAENTRVTNLLAEDMKRRDEPRRDR